MTTFLDQWRIQRAAAFIKQGGVVAYPTEAVYGLGCDPFNHAAVERIFKIKQRHENKGLILIASEWEDIQSFLGKMNPEAIKRVRESLSQPTPITWLFPASERVPPWIRGEHSTVALRITHHPVAKALCQSVGSPIVSTSANIASAPPLRNFSLVKKYFGEQVDFILRGNTSGRSQPTEIRDAITNTVIRASV